ncbi:Callose synthase 1 [Vitis vinifera]|uniref:Callose synthase 1 n=1 Tax=Vitis vinifera TaxID=29760 RepID=A0A438JV34_VITVI|nr:Callose synthase 1 [Vitis vinifera]
MSFPTSVQISPPSLTPVLLSALHCCDQTSAPKLITATQFPAYNHFSCDHNLGCLQHLITGYYLIAALEPEVYSDDSTSSLMQLDERALTEVMKKLFKNYKKWCKYLDRKSSLWLPTIQQEVQQRKLLYMGLYLLIWGEAANLRFMPECLSYIYHHVCVESIFLISVQTYIWLSYAIVGPQAQLSMLKIFVALCSSGCLVGYGKSRMPRMCGRGAWSWVRFLQSVEFPGLHGVGCGGCS